MVVAVYTDGSARPLRMLAGSAASWAFVAVERGLSGDHKVGCVVAWSSGHVVTDAADPDFLGATVRTVNTAELSALYWALVWLRMRKEDRAVVFTDSQYARRAALGRNFAVRNGELVRRVRTACLGMKYRILWIKGHAGHRFNELADRLAGAELNGI